MPSSSARRTWVILGFAKDAGPLTPPAVSVFTFREFVCIAAWLLCLRAVELQTTFVRKRHK